MRYRLFRPLDIEVSTVGFGTWALGGEGRFAGRQLGWGPTDFAEASRAIRCAVDSGVNFFDTADLYGNGAAERLLGETIGSNENVVVCTKFGNREDSSGAGFQDFSAPWLRASVEGSLKRLRRARLDVVLLHSPPDDFDFARYDTTVLADLVKEGKVGCFGVSCRSARGAERVLAARLGTVVEVIYNAVDRRSAAKVLPEADRSGVAVIARVPLASGFLAGTYEARPSFFPSTDYRSGLPTAELEWRTEAANKLAFLARLPGGMAVSALRFCLSHAAVTTVATGMRKVEHVESNVLASDLGPLEADDLRRIEEAVPTVFEGWAA